MSVDLCSEKFKLTDGPGIPVVVRVEITDETPELDSEVANEDCGLSFRQLRFAERRGPTRAKFG
jgi:hypothetical protein